MSKPMDGMVDKSTFNGLVTIIGFIITSLLFASEIVRDQTAAPQTDTDNNKARSNTTQHQGRGEERRGKEKKARKG